MTKIKLSVLGLVVATIATIGGTAASASTATTHGIPADPGATVVYTVTGSSTVTP